MQTEVSAHIESNFNLKNVAVELVLSGQPAQRTTMSVRELEALRSDRAVPASKYGLEAICGASCETGAQ